MTDLACLRALLEKEDPNASAALEAVAAFEQQDWVLIFKSDNADDGELRSVCFLRPAEVEHALGNPSFDLHAGGGRPGFTGHGGPDGMKYEYVTVGAEEVVPLVFHRYFDGPFPNVVELAEDFRLFWDLYEDRDNRRFVTTDELGDVVTVAEWRGAELFVSKRYLRRYQAARQLALSLQVNVDRRGGTEIAHLAEVNVDVSEGEYRFAYHGGEGMFEGEKPNFTRLLGKRVIAPPPIERAGVWPYEAPDEYETFIIRTDDDGEPIDHTCEPDALANYFGKNPEAPHYLTKVFFTRTVFDKYYANPDRYEVSDGYLRASGAWGLRMDDALSDHVVVFLGDLGTDLPYREQQYWKSYNIAPAGDMSETAIRRSFLGQFVDSERVEHRFNTSYSRLNDVWQDTFAWPLFTPLHEGDAHIAHSMHVPTNTGFGQFDEQIVRLAKLVVDYLNEAEIVSATDAPVPGEKGIAKLHRLLAERGFDAQAICAPLRRVQGARSNSATHQKSGDFDVATLLDGASDLRTLFTELLESLIAAFDAITARLGRAA